MRVVRRLLGSIVRWFDNDKAAQARPLLAHCRLYEYAVCPFCARVRRASKRLGVALERVDIDRDSEARTELLRQGGKVQVPCLRIARNGEMQWLYESRDIVRYLQRAVGR